MDIYVNPFRNSFPITSTSDHWADHVVMTGHVQACIEYGHATWTVDGVVSPVCPRCGASK